MTTMEFLERFAGPIATVIAAVTAASVTFVFGLVQYRIARSQANTADAQRQIARVQLEIAYDKLKHDVFEKRYEVYVAAHKLIECAFDPSPRDPMDSEMRGLSEKLGQAQFLFPPDTQDFCYNRVLRQTYKVAITRLEDRDTPEDQENRIVLVNLRSELPKRFERDLSLEQLTRKVRVDETDGVSRPAVAERGGDL